MVTTKHKTVTPTETAQTRGGKYQTFKNLDNVTKLDSTYAETANIGGKSKTLNRPSAVRLFKFKAGLPTGAIITGITVKYKHSKTAASGNKTPNITAPTVTLMNGESAIKYSNGKNMAHKGKAPTTTATEITNTFKGAWDYNLINNNNFGVRIDYPTNANENEGTVRLYYVKVIITYRPANFTLNLQKVKGQYNGDEFEFTATLNNPNKVAYDPLVTITAPAGFSLKSWKGSGKVTKIQNGVYRWAPVVGVKTGSRQMKLVFDVDITYGTGVEYKTCTLEAVESLQQHSSKREFKVYKTKPKDPEVDPETDGEKNIQDDDLKPEAPKIAYVATGERFNLDFQFTQEEVNSFQSVYGGRRVFYISVYNNPDFAIDDFSQETEISYDMVYLTSLNDDYSYEKKYYSNVVGQKTIIVWQGTIGTSTVVRRLDYDVYPSSITTPFASVLTLSNEELNRLGDGYAYTVQSDMKVYGHSEYYNDSTTNSLTYVSSTTHITTKADGGPVPRPDQFVYEFDFKTTSTDARVFIANESLEGKGPLDFPEHEISMGTIDGKLVAQMNGDADDYNEGFEGGTATLDTYYHMKIEYDGATVSCYIDDTLLGTFSGCNWIKNVSDIYFSLFISETGTVTCKDRVLWYGEGDSYVRDWPKSFKIGVFNNAIEDNIKNVVIDGEEILIDTTNYDTLSAEDLIEHAEFWSTAPNKVNNFSNLECEFRYNDDYPLYILICGDYSEADTPGDIVFTEPVIAESQYYEERVSNGVYPVPIDDLVLNDGSTSEININALSHSDKIVFYDFPLDDDYGTNDEIAIRGIALNGSLEQNTDNLILSASLVNSKNESKTRSIVLDELDATPDADTDFTIGQVGDLWGFSTNDIKEFEDWEVHLSLNNAINEFDATCNFGDINLTVFYETIEHQKIKCYIDGEDLSYYGVFIQDVKIPEGLKTDTDYINVNGTDVNNPYRQNIREKTIEVKFDIGDNCDLEAATLSLRQLTRLLVNERDEYNKPIPKRVEFSHYPDVYWEYIMEDTLDNDVELSSYTVKAKLVIPAGTSYDKQPTVTNTTGFLSGLASVRPNIIFKPIGDLITIKETISEQEFNMTYKDASWAGKYIEIDCDNRIVWMKEDEDDEDGINITSYVDWDSDWFTLYGEYNFETVDCAILSVQWEERW